MGRRFFFQKWRHATIYYSFPNLFDIHEDEGLAPSEEEDEGGGESGVEKFSQKYGWFGSTRNICKEGVWGSKINEVRDVNVMEILHYMVLLKDENELQRQMRKDAERRARSHRSK